MLTLLKIKKLSWKVFSLFIYLFFVLVTKTRIVSVAAMAWSATYEAFPAIIHPADHGLMMQSSTEKNKFSIFASAMKNGDVVFWKVYFPLLTR